VIFFLDICKCLGLENGKAMTGGILIWSQQLSELKKNILMVLQVVL
jgi:hypothetical protein